MSLRQMCNPFIEDTSTEPTPIESLDIKSFTKVQQVLTAERNAFQNKNPDHKGMVKLKDLGYSFKSKNCSGSLISELNILKKTNPDFKDLIGQTNVDKIIYYSGKEPGSYVKKRGLRSIIPD
jgi:hypothetical protein